MSRKSHGAFGGRSERDGNSSFEELSRASRARRFKGGSILASRARFSLSRLSRAAEKRGELINAHSAEDRRPSYSRMRDKDAENREKARSPSEGESSSNSDLRIHTKCSLHVEQLYSLNALERSARATKISRRSFSTKENLIYQMMSGGYACTKMASD